MARGALQATLVTPDREDPAMSPQMPSLITEHLVADRRRQLLCEADAYRAAKAARGRSREGAAQEPTYYGGALRRLAARLLPRPA